MADRLRGSAIRNRTPRRSTFWVASADITDVSSLAAGASVLDQLNTWSDNLGPSTIVRTRGTLWVGQDQTAISEFPFGALGFAVVSSASAVVGVTALPTPITDEESDMWFVHQFWASSLLFGSETGFTSPSMSRYDFDSKAMRKINGEQTIVAVVENASASDGMQFLLKFRMLIKTG